MAQRRALAGPVAAAPLGSAPTLDGFCDDAAYVDGVSLPLKPYGDGIDKTSFCQKLRFEV